MRWSKKLDDAFVEPDIEAEQCLHLALKVPSTLFGTSNCSKTTGVDLTLAAITYYLLDHPAGFWNSKHNGKNHLAYWLYTMHNCAYW